MSQRDLPHSHLAPAEQMCLSDAGIPVAGALPTLSSEQLLNGHRAIAIRHGADVYRLCLTRQGKLILTK